MLTHTNMMASGWIAVGTLKNQILASRRKAVEHSNGFLNGYIYPQSNILILLFLKLLVYGS